MTARADVVVMGGGCAGFAAALAAKNPLYLRPLRGPRYYAARARTNFLGTLGGIRVNERAQAVDDFDNTVPGLYAAGHDVGGLHAERYSMWDTSGIASAFAIVSGRTAGENAAAYARGEG